MHCFSFLFLKKSMDTVNMISYLRGTKNHFFRFYLDIMLAGVVSIQIFAKYIESDNS